MNPPPCPDMSPIVQTMRFMKDPFSLAKDVQQQVGDVFKLKLLGMGDWVFVCTPELVQEMFKAPDDILAGGVVNYKFIGHLIGDNASFSLDGEEHDERRRMILPFLNGRKILDHVGILREITLEVFDDLPRDRPFSMLEAFNIVTLKVMCRLVFGDLGDNHLQYLYRKIAPYFDKGFRSKLIFMRFLQWDLGRFSPWGRIMKMRHDMLEAVAQEVDACLTGGGSEEGILMALTRAERQKGGRLSREALIHETVGLLFGAQETTAKVLTWTMAGLLSHPDIYAKTQRIVDEALGDRPIEASDLRQLAYLDAVAAEGARFRPASPVAGVRMVLKDTTLCGYDLAAGTVVTHMFAVTTQRPETFSEPHRFDPDHFYEKRLKPYAFNSFGGGKRLCPGKGFAQLQMTVTLATLLQQFDFELQDPQFGKERMGALFVPTRGLPAKLQDRAVTVRKSA